MPCVTLSSDLSQKWRNTSEKDLHQDQVHTWEEPEITRKASLIYFLEIIQYELNATQPFGSEQDP